MTQQNQHNPGGNRQVVHAILAVAGLYFVGLAIGWPQEMTRQIVAHQPALPGEDAAADEPASKGTAPSIWMVTPFVILLGVIAIFPLLPGVHEWWDSNVNRLRIAGGLALLTLAYYAILHEGSVAGHWPVHFLAEETEAVFQTGFIRAVLGNAVMQEYIPFIVLLFSLYTISGGIRITGDLMADPMTNATFIAIGGLLASLVGTTGAAMLLIRPLLETNQERKHVVHTVVFFIFVVCNCGGCLLPIGDPPLFLGYLEGVPFLWTLTLWKEWLVVNGILIALYLVLDQMVFHQRETRKDIARDVARWRRLRIAGAKLEVPLLIGVVLAVALLDPSKPVPGTNWHAWLYLREVVQLLLVAISLWLGTEELRRVNKFNYTAILEVAALFIGIFICMQPALQLLSIYGDRLGIDTPVEFFWCTGTLSSVLDNAPTYLVFFKTAQTLPALSDATIMGIEESRLVAISLGAVFMGAMTYIGNGPNFMVKSIAEQAGIKMPSFFGYMVYSILVLLPIFALVTWQFLM